MMDREGLPETVRVLAMLGCLAAPAVATPYWVAYEGDDFPENVGWQRNFGAHDEPPQSFANRSIEGGVFVLDSLHDDQIYDYYFIERSVDPNPGELFVAEWRVLVDPRSTLFDTGVGIARDEPSGHVVMSFGPNGVRLHDPLGPYVPYEPGLFHTFRFESPDMVSFTFFVDGTLAYEGSFQTSLLSSNVGFGDFAAGECSLAKWDYVRFGVVPEPASATAFLILLAARRGRRM